MLNLRCRQIQLGSVACTITVCVIWGLGVLIQMQSTVDVYNTKIRLNYSDLYLLILTPIILYFSICNSKEIVKLIGARIICSFVFVVGVFSASIFGSIFIDKFYSTGGVVKYIGIYVLFYYFFVGVVVASVAGESAKRWLAMAIVAFQVLLVCIYTIVLLRGTETILSIGPRLGGFAQNANAQGFFFVCGLALSLAYGSKLWGDRRHPALGVVTSALLVGGILYTGSMAATIAATFMAIVYFGLFLFSWRRLILAAALIALTVSVGPHLLKIEVYNPQTLLGKISALQTSLFENTECRYLRGKGDPFVARDCVYWSTISVRLNGYRSALAMWRDHPWLGAGLGAYLSKQEREARIDAPPQIIHSTYLWLLAELGIFGFCALATFFALVLTRVFHTIGKDKSENRPPQPFVIALVLVFVGWAVMAVFHEMTYQRLLWILAGMCLVGRTMAFERIQVPTVQK